MNSIKRGSPGLGGRRVQFKAGLAVLIAAIAVTAVWTTAEAQQPKLIRHVTPEPWAALDVEWIGDTSPHNKIDDLIDSGGDADYDIVVNFKTCVEDSMIDWLEALDPMVTNLEHRSKYITSVALGTMSYAEIESIAGRVDVAFIEQQGYFVPALNVAVPAIKVTASTTYSPNTVQDAFPSIDGEGVNIAIMDTGVDDVVHDAFNNTPYIGGYDAFTSTFGNPDDTNGHGTHVASSALGQATSGTSRGVAPKAGLIDIKCIPGKWSYVIDALEQVYDKHEKGDWDVHVINMSIEPEPARSHDGTESLCRLVDVAEYFDIVVVACANNYGPNNTGIGMPGAATKCICVANSDDFNTVTRTDDAIRASSNRGPRADDGDHDDIDELKPEVTAPGTNIVAAAHNSATGSASKTGTSMSTALVSGMAALIREAKPSMTAASVKDLIIRTSEVRGTPYNTAIDSTWSRAWGWGLVDAYEAVAATGVTDLTFPNHPPSPSWMSPDISISPAPKVGQKSTVTVDIKNVGAPAADARIHFGVHDFSGSIPEFQDIGTKIVDIPVTPSTPVTMDWTPKNSGHLCMEVLIGYGQDANQTNNKAQRNLAVAASPVHFTVQNTSTEAPVPVFFWPSFEIPYNPQWTINITPPSGSVMLGANDCPLKCTAQLVPPPGAPPGMVQVAHIEVSIGSGEGGVSVRDTVREVPTLSEWGLIVMTLALTGVGACVIMSSRRRRSRAG